MLLKSGSWSKKIEVAKASKGEEISVNLISSEYGKARNYFSSYQMLLHVFLIMKYVWENFRLHFFCSWPGHSAEDKRALLRSQEL